MKFLQWLSAPYKPTSYFKYFPSVFKMTLVLIVFCALTSSNLGRLDYGSLSQQALMELLSDGIENIELVWGQESQPVELLEWHGVKFDTNENVTVIKWESLSIKGSINFQWLPGTVVKVLMFSNYLTGTLDLTGFSQTLRGLILRDNYFSGEIDLTQLPNGFRSMNLSFNQLSGELDVENLPISMKALKLSRNNFTGTINLEHLPDGLEVLLLNENSFFGKIDVFHLPNTLETLSLHSNNFSGLTDFSKLPDALQNFDISNTLLEGEIYMLEEKDFFDAEYSRVKIYSNNADRTIQTDQQK